MDIDISAEALSDLKDGVGFFLRQLEDYPPIDPEKEIELGKIILECRERLLELKKLNGNGTPGDKLEEEKITQKFSAARKELVSHFLRYAVKAAKQKIRKGTGFDNLIQFAVIGLLCSVNTWDYRKGGFYLHSKLWMDTLMNKGHNDMRRFIHRPEYLDKMVRYSRAIFEEAGRNPTREELADRFDTSIKRAEIALGELAVRKISMHEPYGNDEEEPMARVVINPTAINPEILAMAKEQLQVNIVQIQAVIAKIPFFFRSNTQGRNKILFCLRHGLADFEGMSLKKACRYFGISYEMARRNNKYIWKRLSGYLRSKEGVKEGEEEKWLRKRLEKIEILANLTGQKIQILSEEEQAEIARFLQQVS